MAEGQWLTVRETAKRLGLGPVTVQRWLRAGKLPGTLLGRRAGWRIPATAVEAVLRGEDVSVVTIDAEPSHQSVDTTSADAP